MVRQRYTPSSTLVKELASLPGGAIINKCLECGICTAKCIIALDSEYNPRKIVQKILVGAREQVLSTNQPWLCMTCQLCESECQHGITLAQIFSLVRRIAIRDGIIPQSFIKAAYTIFEDGWLLKKAYTDFIADERRELGLSSRLNWNNRYTSQVGSKYFNTGGNEV
ncbi:MAG: 4Fe-4S dicluster domain-containing protein [Candidatus Odinarchaeota archaeon]